MKWLKWPISGPHEDDRRLIAKVAAKGKAGRKAWEQLYLRYEKRFRGYLWSVGLPLEAFEDVMQEAWVQIAHEAGTCSPEEEPAQWLLGQLRNAARRAKYRMDQGARVMSPLDEDLMEEWLEDPAPGPQAVHIEQDVQACVEAGFKQFKSRYPEEAQNLCLSVHHEWTLEELASCRRSSKHATSVYLSRVRKLIRPFLEHCLKLIPDRKEGRHG